MGWHESHNTRGSMSSHYDEVCDDCGATDAAGHEHLVTGPCGMPEMDEEWFKKAQLISPADRIKAKKMYQMAGKETIYKLAYGGDPHGAKWLEFIGIITEITYKPGWYIRVGFDEGRMWMQVGVTEEAEISYDRQAGKKVPWRGAKHDLSRHMCRNEIVSTVYHAFERAELHEVKEWFRYRNASIFNPHLDPDALVEVARFAKNFNTRVNAMTMEEPEDA